MPATRWMSPMRPPCMPRLRTSSAASARPMWSSPMPGFRPEPWPSARRIWPSSGGW